MTLFTQCSLFKPVVIHIRALDLLTPKVIMDRLKNVLQSAEEMAVDDAFVVKTGVVEMPAGGHGHKVINLNKGCEFSSLKVKQSTVEIPYDEEKL